MDGQAQPSSSSSSCSSSPEKQQQPQSPSCTRCRSTDTRFCYYEGGGTTRPKRFCFSCSRFWVDEEDTLAAPLHTAALGSTSCPAAARHVGKCSDAWPSKRTRRMSEAERPRLPCPRCGSSDTRFLKYLSKRHTRPQHFCFPCRRCWIVGTALHGWRWGPAPQPALVRPQCPRCGSPSSRSSTGFCDVGCTKRRHKCLRCTRSWIGEADGWTVVEAVPADAAPLPESSSCSASQPVAEASPCCTSGEGYGLQSVATGASTEIAAAAAAQEGLVGTSACPIMAAVGSAALELGLNLHGNPREARELNWEDIEWIDYVLDCHMRQEFLAAFFPSGYRDG